MKTMTILFVLMFAMISCDSFPDNPECVVRGIQILQEKDRGCGYYENLVNDAVDRLIAAGFITNEKAIAFFADVEVRIWNTLYEIDCGGDTEVYGCHLVLYNRIELNRGGSALAHELLHVVEHRENLVVLESQHEGWGERGAPPDATLTSTNQNKNIRTGSWFHVTDTFATEWYISSFRLLKD
jgi:hypothetical protein